MRRREALAAILAVATASALPGCGLVTLETVDTEPVDVPDAAEALDAVGLPQPDAEITASEGIRASDLDQWSVRVHFAADTEIVNHWLDDAFGSHRGLTMREEDDYLISQRLAPGDVESGSRFFDGSNPEDGLASYVVLVSPEGTDVMVAAARIAR